MNKSNYVGILLASASPRRLDLLRQLCPNVDVRVISSDVDEDCYYDHSYIARSQQLAEDKARAVLREQASCCNERVVIAADTEVAIDGVPFGKANDRGSARKMLQQLSGRIHQVVTGYFIGDDQRGIYERGYSLTTVTFKPLSTHLIEAYLDTNESLGKAGGYGIQGQGVALVDSIEGSYSNVVGLPLEHIATLLFEKFSWDIWANHH